MQDWTIELLECPRCGGTWRADDSHDRLRCTGCAWTVPVRDGVPRFVEAGQDAYVRSFGRQWNRYRVQQIAEDEETFEVKTGVRLADLQGLRVLDAGCGGGRYAYVAGRHGAEVVGVDLSSAVDMARRLCHDLPNVDILQADLLDLPLAPESFDLVFSIGVVHHSPDTVAACRSIARRVRPGGRLSVWVYRRNTLWQEALNTIARGVTTRLSPRSLETVSHLGAALGRIPLVRSTVNKIVNFSNHPNHVNRLCDTFDWYSPVYQHHHTEEEVCNWFSELGLRQITLLPPAGRTRLYRWCYDHDLIIGSGVNVTGVRP